MRVYKLYPHNGKGISGAFGSCAKGSDICASGDSRKLGEIIVHRSQRRADFCDMAARLVLAAKLLREHNSKIQRNTPEHSVPSTAPLRDRLKLGHFAVPVFDLLSHFRKVSSCKRACSYGVALTCGNRFFGFKPHIKVLFCCFK